MDDESMRKAREAVEEIRAAASEKKKRPANQAHLTLRKLYAAEIQRDDLAVQFALGLAFWLRGFAGAKDLENDRRRYEEVRCVVNDTVPDDDLLLAFATATSAMVAVLVDAGEIKQAETFFKELMGRPLPQRERATAEAERARAALALWTHHHGTAKRARTEEARRTAEPLIKAGLADPGLATQYLDFVEARLLVCMLNGDTDQTARIHAETKRIFEGSTPGIEVSEALANVICMTTAAGDANLAGECVDDILALHAAHADNESIAVNAAQTLYATLGTIAPYRNMDSVAMAVEGMYSELRGIRRKFPGNKDIADCEKSIQKVLAQPRQD